MKNFVFTVVSFLLIGWASAQDKTAVNCERSFIEVNGKAEMKVIPDEIYLDITLNEKDDKGRSSLSELEIKLKRALNQSGIDLKNLTVTYASSDFHKRFFGKDIYAVKRYELKLQSVAEVDATLTRLKDQGISNISISRTDYSKREEAKQALRAQALKQARQKAEALLQAIGEQIGKPLSISAQDYLEASPAFFSLKRSPGAAMADKAELPDTDFRPIVLKAEVQAKFQIK